jgi:hypothetical protein
MCFVAGTMHGCGGSTGCSPRNHETRSTAQIRAVQKPTRSIRALEIVTDDFHFRTRPYGYGLMTAHGINNLLKPHA